VNTLGASPFCKDAHRPVPQRRIAADIAKLFGDEEVVHFKAVSNTSSNPRARLIAAQGNRRPFKPIQGANHCLTPLSGNSLNRQILKQT